MIKYNNNNPAPFMATHPGDLISDELEARNMTLGELADLSGINIYVLNDIIQYRQNIDNTIATLLEKALGIPEEDWLNLQNNYNKDTIFQKSLMLQSEAKA